MSESRKPVPKRTTRPAGGDPAGVKRKHGPASDESEYVLTLYVSGMSPRSQRAIDNIRKLCDECLGGHYELEIVDIYQQPALAKGEQILAAPTLIKKLPLPLRRLIGDFSEEGRVMVALGLKKPAASTP